MVLTRDFYERDTFEVARDLLGCRLVSEVHGERTSGMIVEVEPYIGAYDKACHAWPMKRTKRTEAMFGPGGMAYIFFVYGMYHQLCVVTESKGVPDAVLIRSVEPLGGLKIMENRRNKKGRELTNGPGKLTIAMAITKDLYGCDMTDPEGILRIERDKIFSDDEVMAAPRVGVSYAEEYASLPWRFFVKDTSFLSVKPSGAVPYGEVPKKLLGPVH